MTYPIAIFICHQSHQVREQDGVEFVQRSTESQVLHHVLNQHDAYDAWVDDSGLLAGMAWERAIYRQLMASDVLLVLVGPGTSKSEWVQREIALANALGVTVVPVGFELTDDSMRAECKALEIDNIQWLITHNIRLDRSAALLAELEGVIHEAALLTHERQRVTLDELWKRRKPKKRKAVDRQQVATFRLLDAGPSPRLHVASGDLMRMRDIDVVVNSENDYMQMARFFESRTVSAMLRRRGARIKAGLYEDTIQRELDWQLRSRGRPVQVAEVFPTSAGGPDSDLARINRTRMILHVAAVQAVPAENRVVPFQGPQDIEACVTAALWTLTKINDQDGMFSPPGSDQRAEQERRAAAGDGHSTSILFPLFGTGQGGLPVSEIIDPMIDGLTSFFADLDSDPSMSLITDIYISAYAQEDVDIVVSALGRRLHP